MSSWFLEPVWRIHFADGCPGRVEFWDWGAASSTDYSPAPRAGDVLGSSVGVFSSISEGGTGVTTWEASRWPHVQLWVPPGDVSSILGRQVTSASWSTPLAGKGHTESPDRMLSPPGMCPPKSRPFPPNPGGGRLPQAKTEPEGVSRSRGPEGPAQRSLSLPHWGAAWSPPFAWTPASPPPLPWVSGPLYRPPSCPHALPLGPTLHISPQELAAHVQGNRVRGCALPPPHVPPPQDSQPHHRGPFLQPLCGVLTS